MEIIRFKDYLNDYIESKNITVKDFANRLGITQKHLIDILAGRKDISLKIANKISFITNIPVEYIYKVEANYKIEKEIKEYLNENNMTESQYLKKFNYKYLIKEKYLDFTDGDDKLEVIKDILKFLRITSPKRVNEIDKRAYYKSKNDKPELLLLWLEKCYRKSFCQTVKEYKKENVQVLVKYIQCEAKKGVFNEEELIKKFNDNGVYLVIEDDVPGSKIRGAFRVNRKAPAIYLTHKHNRIADVYFALLHELSHLKSEFNKAISTSIVSYEDEVELRADKMAYNWMVDDEYYHEVCVKKDYDISKEVKYPKCFVAYRLAKDKVISYKSKAYQENNLILK